MPSFLEIKRRIHNLPNCNLFIQVWFIAKGLSQKDYKSLLNRVYCPEDWITYQHPRNKKYPIRTFGWLSARLLKVGRSLALFIRKPILTDRVFGRNFSGFHWQQSSVQHERHRHELFTVRANWNARNSSGHSVSIVLRHNTTKILFDQVDKFKG